LESVYDHDLIGASDPFDWARRSAFSAVVSAGHDFVVLAERLGPPPKIIRVEGCDYSSAVLEQLLRREIIPLQSAAEPIPHRRNAAPLGCGWP
jgi:predicted nuclease of predicted toxin-antitoxin system